MTGRHFIFDNIPVRLDIAALESSTFFAGDISDKRIVDAWAEASRVVRPKAIVVCVDVLHDGEGKVTSVGGQPMSSVVLDNNLGELHRAFAYVATCGTEVTAISDGGDSDVKAALFAFRILALREAITYATDRMLDYFDIKKLAMMNPGSLPEWPITEQPKLFAMLGEVESATGVTLGSNMFMSPMESSSGLMFEAEHDYKNCMVCTRQGCIGRQAKYDEELAKQYR